MDDELPAPLLPADVDLRGMNWMPVDTVRLLDSYLCTTANGEQFKAAVILWCRSWREVPASSLPNDEAFLSKISGANARWPKVRDMALRGFVLCADGRLYHPVVAEKALEAWGRSNRQRTNANKRWHKNGTATAMPRHTSGNASADALAMLGQDRTGQDRKGQKEKTGDGDATASKPQMKIDAFALPEWMPEAAWNGWVKMRARIKKPLTERARDMAVAKLKAMKDGGHDIEKILERSEFKNYVDLYPIAEQDSKATSRNAAAAARFASRGTRDG